jgi:hypothetical protein
MQGNLFFIFYSGRYLLSTQSKRTLLLFTTVKELKVNSLSLETASVSIPLEIHLCALATRKNVAFLRHAT